MNDGHPTLSTRLRELSSELQAIDSELKADKASPNRAALQEFRQTLDEIRMTAWTVSELINAREGGKNPGPLLSFLASERMRRLSSMIRDLCADIDKQVFTWQSSGIQSLSDSVLGLQSRITKLIARDRPAVHAMSKTVGGTGA